jgi:DNA-binding LacI/PurR family transcriptional regulator
MSSATGGGGGFDCGPAGSDNEAAVGNAAKMLLSKGHKRSSSKTEFILPPGHEEREQRRRSQAVQVRLTTRTE